MLWAFTLVVAAAAPDVIVVHGVDVAKVKALFPAERTLLDATEVNDYLFKSETLDFQSFGRFAAPTIAGWPVELASVWKAGLTYCAEIAGPAPWAAAAVPGARCCARRLSIHLWGHYLEAKKADQVYELTVVDDAKGASARGVRYGAGAAELSSIKRDGPSGTSAALLTQVVASLLAGEGTKEKRVNLKFLFEPLSDPWKAPPELAPLTLKKSCEALPATLKFKAASPTSKALEARWAAAGKGAPLECSLSFTTHAELAEPGGGGLAGAFGPMEVVTTVLRCGPHVASTELARFLNSGKRPPLESVTTALANGLSERICP